MRYTIGMILLALLLTGCTPPPNSENLQSNDTENYRYFTGTGIPNHETGSFPNKNNPNTISEQNYHFKVTKNPQKARTITQVSLGKFGIATNGIPFDPGAAEFWNNDRNSGWQYEALSGAINLGLDQNNAHVQPTGAYHYHGMPTALVANQNTTEHSNLIGYAADGFPVYARYGYDDNQNVKKMTSSFSVKSGTRPNGPGGSYDGTYVQDYEYKANSGDLDECNGKTGPTPDYPNGIYHYFITDSYPFIPRCFVGTPDSSFTLMNESPANNQAGERRMPPPPRK